MCRCMVTTEEMDADINNVGSIALALYAQSNPEYDHVEASKWQVAQVSTLSLGNFAGRIVIGSILHFPLFPFKLKLYRTDFRLHALPSSHSPCILPVHRVFIIHNISGVHAQYFERQHVVDCNCVIGIFIWESVGIDAGYHDRVVRSR